MSTLTLNLDERYSKALEDMATEQEMTKTQVIRASLRVYQMIRERTKRGEQMAFVRDGVVVPLIVVGLSDPT